MDVATTEQIVVEHVITDKIELELREHEAKVPPLRGPKDNYYLCHVVFFFVGIIHMLPMIFFNAANNFWMYKFRNLSDPTESAGNRTSLQTHYASSTMVASTIIQLLFGVLNVAIAHKIKIMNRIIYTLLVEVIIFFTLTAFVKIDTDNYQGLFFAIVLTCSATIAGCNTINMVASQMLYPRFPEIYMKTCMIGEGAAGLFGDILNIVSVAIFDEITDSTLMYFVIGSSMMGITLVLILLISRTEYFNHYFHSMPEDLKKDMPGKTDMFRVFKKIRFCLLLNVLMLLSMSASHTSITSLVVSEQDSTTSSWAKKFFTPVLTFLWTDTSAMIGRFVASHSSSQTIPQTIFLIASLLRTGILVPFIWFCNAQPRNHLTVLFPHDYQYAIIIGTFMFVNGYIMTMSMLLIQRKTTKHDTEIAFNVFNLFMGITSASTSLVGLFIVNIL